jgi:outer membrane protein
VIFIFSLFIILLSSTTYSQNYRLDQKSLPLWEVGAGISWAQLPYYPGSKGSRKLTIPYPSFIYRGDKIRADEDGGLRGLFVKSERFEINASFGFNLPADQDDIAIRAGMNKLDPLIEIGPGLIYHIIPRKKSSRFSLSLNLGMRMATSTNFSYTKHRGFIFNPLIFGWTQISKKLVMFNGLSTSIATKNYHAFFYDVEDRFANTQRTSYKSRGGFVGSTLSTFFIYNVGSKLSLFAGGLYENFTHARNRQSPLHESDHNTSLISGVTYWFYKSKRTLGTPL